MSTVPAPSSRPVLLAVSHGTSSAEGDRAVAALVAAVREAAGDHDARVRGAFVDVQTPDVPTVLADLGPTTPCVVVPLLLSAGYHVHVDLAQAVGARSGRTVLAGALGPDPRLVAVLEHRLVEAGVRGDDVVVLCAAGSSDARAVAECRAVAAMLDDRLGGGGRARVPVAAAFVSASTPEVGTAVRAAREAYPGRRVVVSTYLLAPGWFSGLVARCGADLVTAPLLLADGPVPPELVEVVLGRYAAAVGDLMR